MTFATEVYEPELQKLFQDASEAKSKGQCFAWDFGPPGLSKSRFILYGSKFPAGKANSACTKFNHGKTWPFCLILSTGLKRFSCLFVQALFFIEREVWDTWNWGICSIWPIEIHSRKYGSFEKNFVYVKKSFFERKAQLIMNVKQVARTRSWTFISLLRCQRKSEKLLG